MKTENEPVTVSDYVESLIATLASCGAIEPSTRCRYAYAARHGAAVECEAASDMAWRMLMAGDIEGAGRWLERIEREEVVLREALEALRAGR